MPISQTIADFAGALDAARAELATVNAKVDELEAERRRIVAAPPHTDDIAAVFLRGVDATSNSFTRQFRARLADTYVGGDAAAAAAAPQRTAELLQLETQKLDREALLTRSMVKGAPDLNVAALTYFLRDRIEAAIPALVDGLCPEARDGMKQADREAALRDIDAQIATMRTEAERLHADLGAARAAVSR